MEYYGGAGDAPSVADESARGEMDELLILLEEKDADLRRAAELGKMLLDEKEADAEAHEGEKEALWRRIQDMARRVMELEQEAAESRDEFSLHHSQQAQAHHHHQHQPLAAEGSAGGGGFGRRVSIGGGGGGGDRAEERALRAKNEMLERQLAHMREAAEEAQLELAAARKAQFSGRSSRHQTRSGRSNSILSSPAASFRLGRAERSLSGGEFSAALGPLSPAGSLSPGHFPAAAGVAAADGGGGTCVTPSHRHHRRSGSRLSSSVAPALRWSVRSPRSAGGGGVGDDGDEDGDGDGADSEASNDELRAADRAHASPWRARLKAGGDDRDSDGSGAEGGAAAGDDDGDAADEHDAAWLLEQNAWLMDELESKDELIEALREQLEELKQQQQQRQWGGQGQHPSSSSTRPLGGGHQPADSDDSDDNDSERGQRSFLDHLLQASGGGKPTNQLASGCGSSSFSTDAAIERQRDTAITNCADAFPGATGEVDSVRARRATLGVARENRRPFGGILAENATRNDENPGAENTSGNRAQSKSPTRDGVDRNHDVENSRVRATSDKQRRAFSPTRRGAAAEHETASYSLSPVRSGRRQAVEGEVTGVVGQTQDAALSVAGAGAVAGSGLGDVAIPGASTTAVAATGPASEKVAGRAETKEVAAGTPREQQERYTVVSSSPTAPSVTPVSVDTPPLPRTAAAATAASPGVVVPARKTTVRSRKRAATAAKVRAREQEAAAAAAAAAEAKHQEDAASSSSFAPMSRSERKSRQAVEKLGLRTVKGVFRMTMRTTNGVVFVVKAPDVFKHPQQDTYVVFGTADTDLVGGELSHVSRPPPRVPTPVPMSASIDGKTGFTRAAAISSRPDPSAVESESVSAGLDPADVLTIVSHAGCSPRAAICALREAGGDMVNAVMKLTDASSASA